MSTSKADLKWIRSLQMKKFRNEHSAFVVEGRKMVEEALQHADVSMVLTTDDAFEASVRVERISSADMARISGMITPSPYFAVVQQALDETWELRGKACMVLDGIADPGNFGTIIRTAEWFGVQSIFCTSDTVDCYNPKSIQSSMGSIFRQHIRYGSPEQIARFLSEQGCSITAAVLNGDPVFRHDWSSSVALLIGSESHGVRPHWEAHIQHRVTIPGVQGAESLNAAIASAILMAEHYRTIQ